MQSKVPPDYQDYLARRSAPTVHHNLRTAVTWRGVLVGSLLCALIAVGAPYARQIIKGTALALTSATPVAFFLLFVLLLTLHLLLGRCRREWAFTRGELITIFAMMTAAAAIPTKGVVSMLLPIITGFLYYASPENQWAAQVHPLLPRWILVDDAQAITDFYEGGATIPWAHWLPPLAAWFAFYMALYLTLLCISAILRRQWVDYERLAYPLAQAPLAMIDEGTEDRLLKPFFRNWVMWAGFAIPFLLSSLGALHHYFPQVAAPGFSTAVQPIEGGRSLQLNINFLMLGLAYFINLNISLSLWLFYLIAYFQDAAFGVMGIHSQADLGHWSVPIRGHLMMGAIAVLLGAILWNARHHLKAVLQRAWDGTDAVDDQSEIMSFRAAVVGTVVGFASLWFWLWQTGLPAWIALLVLAVGLTIFVVLARVIAETGLPIVKPSMIPAGFTLSGVGSSALGPHGTVALGYTMVWCGDLLVFMMAPLANSLRLVSELKSGQRRLFWALAAAMLLTWVLSMWYTLHLAYRHGAINLYLSTHYATEPSRLAARHLLDPTEPSLAGWLWTSGGGAIMAGLLAARRYLLWWPLHPIGFVVGFGRVMERIWFAVFLAWLSKKCLLRFGGAAVYHRMQPFFLGMALGHISSGGVWLLIDGVTGTVGNRISLY